MVTWVIQSWQKVTTSGTLYTWPANFQPDPRPLTFQITFRQNFDRTSVVALVNSHSLSDSILRGQAVFRNFATHLALHSIGRLVRVVERQSGLAGFKL